MDKVKLVSFLVSHFWSFVPFGRAAAMRSQTLPQGSFAPRSEGPMEKEDMQYRRKLFGLVAGLSRDAHRYRSFHCESSQKAIIPRNRRLSLETEDVLACSRGTP